MPVANPLVGTGAAPVAPPPDDTPAAAFDPDFSASGGLAGYGVSVGADFTHPDNTNIHVAILVAAALGVVIIFHAAGFRFAVDAGVTRG